MRATFMYGAGDVRVDTVPDPVIKESTDAVVRVVLSCICGSDLHPYHNLPASSQGTPMGHEFLGVVEELGSQTSRDRPVHSGRVGVGGSLRLPRLTRKGS